MKTKWLFSIIAVISLVLALSPGVAFADTAGDIAAGSFGCRNAPPTVDNVALYLASNDSAESAMSPQTEYYVKATVGDANTLNDLQTVKVYIYYDADGSYSAGEVPSSGVNQTCAILTWTNGGSPSEWTIDAGSGTSWTQETSTKPTLTLGSGDFKFNFKPGKVATATVGTAKWHIHVVADDGSGPVADYQPNRTMNWYGEITVIDETIDWGNVDAGLDFQGTGSENASISVKYLANGNYSEKIGASSPWTSSGEGATLDTNGLAAAANSFSLKADDSATYGSAVVVKTTASYESIDDGGTITGESGNQEDANSIWLKLNATFVADTYTGTIYYQIASR